MLVRVLAASIAGGIAFFILGFVIYGLILDPMVMKPNMIEYPGLMKDPPVWVPLVLANIVSAFLLAYIFENWASIRTFSGGLRGGAIIYFLISLSFQLLFLAFWNLSKNYIPTVADLIGSTVMGAIGGGVVGLVLGLMNKDAPAAR